MKKPITIFFCLLAVLTGNAQTFTFTGTGNWSNTALWSPSYPGSPLPSNDTIIIDGNCTQDIGRSINASAFMYINPGATLNISATITLTINGTFTNNGALSIAGMLTNNKTATNNGQLTVSLTGRLNAATGDSDLFYNNGTITNNGRLDNSGTFTNTGPITNNLTFNAAEGNGDNFINNGVFLNQGAFTNSGVFNNNNQMTNAASGTMVSAVGNADNFINAGIFTNSGQLDNDGIFTNNNQMTNTVNGSILAAIGNSDKFVNNSSFTNHGLFTNEGITTNSTTFINEGIVSTGNGLADDFFNNGNLENNGTLTWITGDFFTGINSTLSGDGLINTAGKVLVANGSVGPGSSPGALTIAGNLTIAGSLDIELGGFIPGTQHDQLIVTGNVQINVGAVLNVSVINSFFPTTGNQFVVLTWLTRSGALFTENLPGDPGAMITDYNLLDLTLAMTAPLPVTWLSFRATLNDGNGVDLDWSTASESNNEGFDIERSANGRDWESIAFVPGAGTTSEVQNYQFTDPAYAIASAGAALIYYRLKQTDFSGAFEYSPIRIVEIHSQNDIRVFPNPADEEISIAFSQATAERGLVQLFNQQGRLVVEEPLSPQTTEHQLRLSSLPAGIYILRATVGREQWTKRVVVE
ncbi:MAG: T9SS type A sorting domain-containing protein [Saprospirales bacterium]|nr:T9SS type A sorting domain-containing protein [Saprospirales bacterium]